MTADTSLLVPGLAATTSQLSSPGGGGTGGEGGVAPQQASGTETTPTTTDTPGDTDPTCEDGSMATSSAAGAEAAQVECDPGTQDVADQNGSGDAGGAAGSGSGGGSGGGGDDALPFTGFPAGLVAGLGGAVTAAGVALRSAVRRSR